MVGNGDEPLEAGGVPEDLTDQWATLKDASARFGVSVSALRKWYRAPNRGGEPVVRSRMEDGPYGPQRVVNLGDVVARIAATGAGGVPAGRPDPPELAGPDMLPIPRDSFAAMMAQLGNLHQAGQDLADMTGRASAAERTVEHLREQLAEVRARGDVERAEYRAALAEAWGELEQSRTHKGRARWWHRLIGQGETPAGE